MSDMDIEIKKNIFVQLAFSLYGHLVLDSKDTESQKVVAKSMGFVVNEVGDFYLVGRKTKSLLDMDFSKKALFTVIKEGKTVSDMSEIQVRGSVSFLDWKSPLVTEAKKLFEDKSPYFGTIPFLEDPEIFSLLKISPDEIFYQNLNEEREEQSYYILEKFYK